MSLRGYGVRELGGNARVDADTVFQVASITKAFNATALAMLVDEGRVRWTDPVLKHIPEFQLHDPWMTREVTLIDCLAHRTGLRNRTCCRTPKSPAPSYSATALPAANRAIPERRAATTTKR